MNGEKIEKRVDKRERRGRGEGQDCLEERRLQEE